MPVLIIIFSFYLPIKINSIRYYYFKIINKRNKKNILK
jgi:hypothetical protein